MKRHRARRAISRCITACLLLAAAGCRQQPPEIQSNFYVLGTEVSIVLRGQSNTQARVNLRTAQQTLQRLHRDWHAWEPGMLTDLNLAFASGRCAQIDLPLRRVLKQAQDAERLTDGLFNAAAGALLNSWGFHTSSWPITTPPPDPQTLRRIVDTRPSMSQVSLDSDCVGARNQALRIDLGGIGKGAAVDLVIDQLKADGVPAALVNAGGDLRGYGASRKPWRIAVRDPSRSEPLAVLALEGDEAVFTSGGYARYGETADERYAHILDPRTGQPARGTASVTVIAGLGARADAAATALVIAGPDGAWPVFRKMQLKHMLMIDDSGCVLLDAGLLRRLEFPAAAPACLNIMASK